MKSVLQLQNFTYSPFRLIKFLQFYAPYKGWTIFWTVTLDKDLIVLDYLVSLSAIETCSTVNGINLMLEWNLMRMFFNIEVLRGRY